MGPQRFGFPGCRRVVRGRSDIPARCSGRLPGRVSVRAERALPEPERIEELQRDLEPRKSGLRVAVEPEQGWPVPLSSMPGRASQPEQEQGQLAYWEPGKLLRVLARPGWPPAELPVFPARSPEASKRRPPESTRSE